MIKDLWRIIVFTALLTPCVLAETFSDNSEWGTVKTTCYSASVHKNGSIRIRVNNSLFFKTSFIQRWNHNQYFPQVKLMNASMKHNKEKNSITLLFKYFWNNGEVMETLIFKSRSINASFSYVPSQAKNISRFACFFRILKPAKPDELKLIGMQRHRELDGALNILDNWNSVKTGMKMISIKNTGPYQVNIIAEDNGWISFWNWPNFGIINNGNYPKWDKTLYKAGEEFKINYHIDIVPPNGKINSSSKLEFVFP